MLVQCVMAMIALKYCFTDLLSSRARIDQVFVSVRKHEKCFSRIAVSQDQTFYLEKVIVDTFIKRL